MTLPPPAFTLAVGGIGFRVHLPDDAWLSELAPLYRAFPLTGEPGWQVAIRCDPEPASASERWIEHDGLLTRFSVDGFSGWIDLQRCQAEVRAASLAQGASAVERGVGYACMHAQLRQRHGLMLHAAGILWRGQGLVACGPSGAGKTTLARLALGHGDPFNDEVVVVDLAGPRPVVMSTPILGQGTPPELRQRVNRVAPLRAVLLLAHGPTFELTPVEPAEAVLELLRSNIAAVERLSSARLWMDRVDQLVRSAPVYRLRFRPTAELWEFLAGALDVR